MTQVTVGLMGSTTEFAAMVRRRDLGLLHYYQSIVYPVALLVVGRYLWPIIRHFRCDPDQPASLIVQRRTVSAPLVVAGIGFSPWLFSSLAFPIATIVQFGHWSPELASQQVL